MQKETLETKAVFAKAVQSSKNQKIYVSLSNGIETKLFPTKLPLEAFEGYEKGEEVDITVEIDVFDSWGTSVISISK
jgi:hypothetical protein